VGQTRQELRQDIGYQKFVMKQAQDVQKYRQNEKKEKQPEKAW
jgi:hypothetical protein